MKIYDITVNLGEKTEVYEGDPKYSRTLVKSVAADGYELSILEMGSHAGTHVDAPSHFVQGGKSLAQIEIERFIGDCYVTNDPLSFPEHTERILIKGENCEISPEIAHELVKRGVRLVGTELLSVGDEQTHRILLGEDIVVLEKLNLADIAEGNYTLFAPPLKIDADGCPVRAFLVRTYEE